MTNIWVITNNDLVIFIGKIKQRSETIIAQIIASIEARILHSEKSDIKQIRYNFFPVVSEINISRKLTINGAHWCYSFRNPSTCWLIKKISILFVREKKNENEKIGWKMGKEARLRGENRFSK